MNKPRYFFNQNSDDPERCFTLDYFVDELSASHEDEIILLEAVMLKGESFFYCKELQEIGESSFDCCGKHICKEYKPRNGKNGRCKHHRNTYEQGTRKFRLTITRDLKTYTRKINLELI